MRKLSHIQTLVCLCFLIVKGVWSVYFTRSTYVFGLLESLDHPLGQVIALPNNTDNCQADAIVYNIVQASVFNLGVFGWIHPTKSTDLGNGYNLTVQARCSDDPPEYSTNAFLRILPKNRCKYNSSVTPEEFARNVCFQNKVNGFSVEENVDSVTLGNISPCSQTETFVSRNFEIVKDRSTESIVLMNQKTGELRLNQALDREKNSSIKFSVNCTVSVHGKHTPPVSTDVKINVIDTNDNPPFFQKTNRHELLFQWNRGLILQWNRGDSNPLRVIFLDKDKAGCDAHVIDVSDNGFDVCSVKTSTGHFAKNECITDLRISIAEHKIPILPFHSCQVVIQDPGYSYKYNKSKDLALLEIQFKNVDIKLPHVQFNGIQAYISNRATRLSRVIQLHNEGATSKRWFFLKHPVFNITKNSGIIYVDNITNFHDLSVSETFNISATNPLETITVRVNIQGNFEEDYDERCELTCSRNREHLECRQGCGLGTETGRCFWRYNSEAVGRMSKDFETCSPNVTTCPDFKCDELERLYPLLCPQDCSVKISGEFVANRPTGIRLGKSPCWCDYGTHCTCLELMRETSNPSLVSDTSINNQYPRSRHTNKPGPQENGTDMESVANIPRVGAQHGKHESCGDDCRTTIAATVGCVGAVICVVILAWRLRRRTCQRNHGLKDVGSVVSMSAVPSDYFDERDYRTAHSSSSPQWSPKRQSQYYPTPEDKKWEYERDNIELVQTLGEGEFGRVVQAKYYDSRKKDSFKYVAVKMLKTGCASSSEEQDLWSEFNLLKDVNHPNVVRLLGACTQGGPFYLIVEFCEKGSLLHFLRRSSIEENGYMNFRFRHRLVRRGGEPLEPTEKEILNIRDFLSFAWQIAKGMQYLSQVKLVHRDLAARNVLVASNKVLKISDFGLTRDVYEADTYLKQSKGRIPVKWLAPESLYAQIYTTQSDVWSYGIVLWEIVTLGAPPYPGVPPERLYNLLMAGYRMDRPEMCSDEFYAVMQKCWKSDPFDRPIFADLANIFDRMLQQKTDYLDLSSGFEDVTPDVYDRCFGTSFASSSSENQHPKYKNQENNKYGSLVSSTTEQYVSPSNSQDDLETSDNTNNDTETLSDIDSGYHCDKPDQEKLSLCLEKCAAAFTNSPEEDVDSDETGLLQNTMI